MSELNIRILSIAPYRFLPVINGGHKAIEQLYKNLGELTPTIVVSTRNNDELVAGPFKMIRLFSNNPLHYINVFYFFKLKALLKNHNITHVITEHPYMGWLGFLLQQYVGVRFIVRSHNIEAMRFKTLGKGWWKAMWYYERWAHRKADLSFFITEEDRQFAMEQYKLSEQKTAVLTYGIDERQVPSGEEKQAAKKGICSQYNIPFSHTLVLFNGDFGYAPNSQAVEAIITQINPLLLQNSSFAYTIFICGRSLPDISVQQIKSEHNIIYAGYVDDIIPYFLAADIFINPVTSGGGIKTKLVEAISHNCSAVSTQSGAKGVFQNEVGSKLIVVDDCDWKAFAGAVISSDVTLATPATFYNHFYWGNIAKEALQALKRIT